MQDGESRMVPGAPGTVCSLVEKTPGDGKKIAVQRRRTHQIHLLSLLEKNRRHKFNWLIKAQRKDLAVNWLRAHKTNAGTHLAWLSFHPGVTSLKMCFIIAKRHALQLPYCVLDKG